MEDIHLFQLFQHLSLSIQTIVHALLDPMKRIILEVVNAPLVIIIVLNVLGLQKENAIPVALVILSTDMLVFHLVMLHAQPVVLDPLRIIVSFASLAITSQISIVACHLPNAVFPLSNLFLLVSMSAYLLAPQTNTLIKMEAA